MRGRFFAGLLLGSALGAAAPVAAFEMPEDEAEASFIGSNIVSTFYHELGHALIDVMQVPVLGKEEDAADTLSALLVHAIWNEEAATEIITDTALSYALYSAEAEAAGDAPSYSDEHSLDQQRYYNLICLFYGASPGERQATADALELPAERAERCPDEFAQAQAAWGTVLDGLELTEGAMGLVLVDTDPDDPIGALLQAEIVDFNAAYGLPEEITVQIAPCGQANAFYDPSDRSITICSEYAEDAQRIYEASQ